MLVGMKTDLFPSGICFLFPSTAAQGGQANVLFLVYQLRMAMIVSGSIKTKVSREDSLNAR